MFLEKEDNSTYYVQTTEAQVPAKEEIQLYLEF